MKIYTEVNYEWKNDKLVELSSDSYEYKGTVEEAKGVPKIKKPAIVAKIQKAAASGATQLRTNVHSATSTTKSNVTGATTAATTGLKAGGAAAKAGVNTAYSGVKALGKKIGGDALGKLTGALTDVASKAVGGQAGGSQKAMGSTSDTKEKSSISQSKGQIATAKRKKSNTGKNKLKVRVA